MIESRYSVVEAVGGEPPLMILIKRHDVENHDERDQHQCTDDHADQVVDDKLAGLVKEGYEVVGLLELFTIELVMRSRHLMTLASLYRFGEVGGTHAQPGRTYILYLKSSGDIFSRISD